MVLSMKDEIIKILIVLVCFLVVTIYIQHREITMLTGRCDRYIDIIIDDLFALHKCKNDKKDKDI